MNFDVKQNHPKKLPARSCLVLGVHSNKKLSGFSKNLGQTALSKLTAIIKNCAFAGNAGDALMLHDVQQAGDAVLLLGCGEKKGIDHLAFNKIINTSLQQLKSHNIKHAFVDLIDALKLVKHTTEQALTQAVVTASYNLYEFNDFKSKQNHETALSAVTWLTSADAKTLKTYQSAVKVGIAIGAGMDATRNLGNTPSNVCTPSYMADYSQKLAKKYKALNCKVLNKTQMEKLKMGSFLSVAKGSIEPPKLVCLEYNGGKKSDKPIVLVGKGITFDTGGASLKPALSMVNMKYDMCGAASVVGTIKAIAELGLKLNVVGILACAENMPSDRCSKPDDIVTSMSGQTIEIANTDAEGRLVLCDALTYSAKYKPKTVIDIATLTGACLVALGSHATAVYSNTDKLANDLIDAGEAVNDRAWHMPLWDEYQPQLKSPVADMCNIGGPFAGSVTAACFLSRFTKDFTWAHMDIAGSATTTNPSLATGRPVALLTQYLINQSK